MASSPWPSIGLNARVQLPLITFINLLIRFPWQPPFVKDVLNAAKEVKFGTTDDMVGKKITGFTIAQTISNDGVRLSASRAYLWPARNHKNLHVTVNATVTRIITRLDGKQRRATGVEYFMVSRPTPRIP